MIYKYQSVNRELCQVNLHQEKSLYFEKDPEDFLRPFKSIHKHPKAFLLAFMCKDAQRLTNSSNLQYMLNIKLFFGRSVLRCLFGWGFFRQDCFCGEGIFFSFSYSVLPF